MEMKGFQFSDKSNHSPGMPGSYRWTPFYIASPMHTNWKGLFWWLKNTLWCFAVLRPGSASPSGKPSGPGGSMGPLSGHYTQQVWLNTQTLHVLLTRHNKLGLQKWLPRTLTHTLPKQDTAHPLIVHPCPYTHLHIALSPPISLDTEDLSHADRAARWGLQWLSPFL